MGGCGWVGGWVVGWLGGLHPMCFTNQWERNILNESMFDV